ncbi:MAG: D-Ala-D-Ala carboxypeptidase family metallohydrolase [Cypionkella sp.]|nr:D-Ala-D-Ala carboxypeptidase family metallohydrolase [Cypionkella sp.]
MAPSKHMLGTAFDIAMSNHDPVAFAETARAVGFLGFGTYPRSGFMHIDLGPARSSARLQVNIWSGNCSAEQRHQQNVCCQK